MDSKETQKKVFIYNNACQRRRVDAKKITEYLSKNNFDIVNDPNGADYIVFVTCAFLDVKIDECIEIIKKLQEYDAELIVAGCLPEIAEEKLKTIFNGKTFSTKNLDKIDEIFTNNKIKIKDIDDQHHTYENFNPFGILKEPLDIFEKILEKSKIIRKTYTSIKNLLLEKFDYFAKIFPYFIYVNRTSNSYILVISRGCIHNCSYCAIRKAVGPLKSKPIDQILEEFKSGLKKGFTSFYLDADDVGIYGLDTGSSLPELLNEITKIEGNYSFVLMDTHPRWIKKYINELVEIVKRKKIKKILLSVQSGNNRILKLMRRPYTKEDLYDTIPRLKAADPNLQLGVELIIGFPSEKMEEFEDTLELIKKLHFDYGTLFAFSPTVETDALKIEPKISNSEKRRRLKVALKLLKKMNYYAHYSRIINGISFYVK
jgi:tRNA A37 methylthiotransferase MiaB